MGHLRYQDFVNEARNPKLVYKEKSNTKKEIQEVQVLMDEVDEFLDADIEFKKEIKKMAKRFKNLANTATRIKAEQEYAKDKLLSFVNEKVFDAEDRFITRKLFIAKLIVTIAKTSPLEDKVETITTIDYAKILEDLKAVLVGHEAILDALIKANTTTVTTVLKKEDQREKSPSITVKESLGLKYDEFTQEQINENVVVDMYLKVKEWISNIKKMFIDTDAKIKSLGKTIKKYYPDFEEFDFEKEKVKVEVTGLKGKLMKFMGV